MRRTLLLVAALLIVAEPLLAQRGGGGRGRGGAPVQVAPNSWPLSADSASYIRRTPPTDPVIQRIFAEGMQRSQVMRLAQVFLDSLGPRLTGSVDSERAQQWTIQTYASWGINARLEPYGTWLGWRDGPAHAHLVYPRRRALEVNPMGWTPGTNGRWEEGDVVILPASITDAQSVAAWLPSVRGKFVLAHAPQLSCRMPSQWQQFGTPASQERHQNEQNAVRMAYNARLQAAGGVVGLSERLRDAGGLGLLTMQQWSQYPGINKVFGSPRTQITNVDVGCEDYGLLFRLAENNQAPRIRLFVEAERLGERPVSNVIAEIRGSERPNEYVMLSAHFDSFAAGSGATDNATGTLVMLEAMRILRQVYPQPKRTILVGHWNGEEQGLNGSRAFVEDNPHVVAGLHALWNQDNGTGRITSMGPGPFANVRPVLERYLGEMPSEITQWIRLGNPSSGPATGGSDHASFQCLRAPGLSLGALSWDYSNTTWHTNRDTFDKVIPDDLMNNATLVAMLTYLASEDPQKMPRDLVPLGVNANTGQPQTWPDCARATRRSQDTTR